MRLTGVAKRRINEDTCRKYRYGWAEHRGQQVQVAQYASRHGSDIVAQKWRSRDKDFGWVGQPKAAETLFGRHVWGREGGRRVIITEGEIDCLSVAQVLGLKWPVVSLANGAGSAENAVKANLEWLEAFDEVVLMFDMDEDGQKAARDAAQILSPGRARIAILPMKDANEMLMAGKAEDLVKAQWEARPWRPDGVLEGEDLWTKVTADVATDSLPYPWGGLNEKLLGLRRKEIVMVCAGTGIGKSTVARELGVHLMRSGRKLGWIALEESVRESVLSMLSTFTGRPLRHETPPWAEIRPLWDAHLRDRLVAYDHFGSLETAALLSRIRYMVKGLGCDFVGLDHVTMAVSGLDSENERKDLDVLMTRLRQLVEETGVGLLLVSQLKRRSAQGGQYEDGATPRLSDLRGSAALEQCSDVVIAAGREQAKGDNFLELTVLKNRPVGRTGPAGTLEWLEGEARYREVSLGAAA